MRVHSPLVGVYGPSLFCMHLSSFEPPAGSAVPRVGDPFGQCSGSIRNPYSDPQARSDPSGESEPKPENAQ